MRAAVSVGNREACIGHGFWGDSWIELVNIVALFALSMGGGILTGTGCGASLSQPNSTLHSLGDGHDEGIEWVEGEGSGIVLDIQE